MPPEQQRLVRDGFSKVAPNAGAAASLFYERLFALDPALRPLFKGDMEAQGAKLMATIGVAVDSLDRLHEVVPKLRALGRQHAALGVQDAHDATVAEALLWTLGQGLGTDFTDRAREAWTACYAALSGEMKAGAAGP